MAEFEGFDRGCGRACFSVCEEKAAEHIIVILSQHEAAHFTILSHRTLSAETTQ